MKIAILGSTGYFGLVLLEQAILRNMEVSTLVREPEKLVDFKDKVNFVKGDVFNPEDIEKAVTGSEAVLSTIGPPMKNDVVPERYQKAMENIIEILERQNIKRYIHTGGAAHPGGENENWSIGRRVLRLFLMLIAKPMLTAKGLEWEVLKKSQVNWTLVRPPRIAPGKSKGKQIKADEKNLATLQINIEDLANFMLDQIESEEWIRKAPLVASA